MSKFKYLILFISMVSILVLTGCADNDSNSDDSENASNAETEAGEETENGNGNGEEIVLRLGHGTATNSLYHAGSEKFKELVEEKTDGEVTVEIFPDGQLGHDNELTDGMGIGTIEMGMIGVEPLTSISSKLMAVNLPYVFQDRETAYSVLDGEIGKEMVEELPESNGIRVLGYFENGFRHISNSQREINSVDDMEGLSIRTPESSTSMAIFRALGANPTPMAFGELYTGLQQGTVDGQENPVSLFYTSRFYETQDNLALTRHIYSPMLLTISEQIWTTLSPENQEKIELAASEAKEYERELSLEQEEEFLELVESEGVTITEPNLDEFIEATDEVYIEFEEEIGADFYERMMEATN